METSIPAPASWRMTGRSPVCIATVPQSIRAVISSVSVRKAVTATKTHDSVTTLGRGCFGRLCAESVLMRSIPSQPAWTPVVDAPYAGRGC